MTSISKIIFVALMAMVAKSYVHRIWPWGLAQPWNDRMVFSEVDPENDSLRAKYGRIKRIYERVEEGQEALMKGPETVLFGNDGTMYILSEEGFLISFSDYREEEGGINISAKSKVAVDLGMGRPLGGAFDAENNLYIADAHLGLLRVKNPGSGSKVEMIASRVLDKGEWSQILYANDVAVGPKTGIVYFTDSTEIAPDRKGTISWDTMFASKMDCIRGSKTGRLLQYDPRTDEVKVLATGFHFANGVAVDAEEKWVLFVETFTLRLQQYDLATGIVKPVVESGLTGFPDGLDCAWPGVTSMESSNCFAVLPSSVTPLLKFLIKIPHPFDMWIRSLILGLPKSLAPPTKRYGGIVEYNPSQGSYRILQDPDGSDIGMLNGATVHDNKVYLGSLQNDFVAVYHL